MRVWQWWSVFVPGRGKTPLLMSLPRVLTHNTPHKQSETQPPLARTLKLRNITFNLLHLVPGSLYISLIFYDYSSCHLFGKLEPIGKINDGVEYLRGIHIYAFLNRLLATSEYSHSTCGKEEERKRS